MEKDNDIIEIISGRQLSFPKKLKERFASLEDDLSAGFIRTSYVVCAVVLALSATLGILVPKSEKAITERVSVLKTTYKEYTQVKDEYDEVAKKAEELEKTLTENEETLEKFNNSQDNLSKITDDVEELTEKRDELKKQLETKKTSLSDAEATISATKTKTVTLNSGEYTVGKNLAQGSYNVLGSGTIAISRNGKSIANKSLKSDGESFTLENDDKIVISGNAKFIPQ